ncbi:polysaccharide pyruvyl transferase family protein [Roseobacter sp.]|uniref:polysaccharide pyruvyl transferase family protein n=1 Tax=Roseobacter sp. TaxID=1907202 RepID=UPI0032980AC0
MTSFSATLGPAPIIRCLNVKYSPNLGDGLLSECLEWALLGQGADPRSGSIDLAGRTEYGQSMAGRGAVMSVLETMPPSLRQQLVRVPLAIQSRRKWQPHYETSLQDAQYAVIGGGNLLSDMDLNFPTKLRLALSEVRKNNIPAAIFAAGMGGHWSREGLKRMRAAVAGGVLNAVYLRDEASKDRWDRLLGDAAGCQATVVRDPGLLARLCYPQTTVRKADMPTVALGIMSSVAIRYHSDIHADPRALRKWYVDLATALHQKGARVVVFTNGAPEDLAELDAVLPDLRAAVPSVVYRPFQRPSDIAELMANCDAVAAYRMHALIAAQSFGVPTLAMAWDDKVASFLASVGRGDWLFDANLPAQDAANILLDLAQNPIDAQHRDSIVSDALNDVATLYQALCRAGSLNA